MKKPGFMICYIALPAAAAIGMKLYLDKRKNRTAREPVKLCLRPVKWKVSLER